MMAHVLLSYYMSWIKMIKCEACDTVLLLTFKALLIGFLA